MQKATKMNIKLKKKEKHKKIYTFNVICSFNLQYSFSETEVEPDPEGGKGDFIPTDEAIENLEKELTEAIENNYPITDFQVDVDSDQLLGVGVMEDI